MWNLARIERVSLGVQGDRCRSGSGKALENVLVARIPPDVMQLLVSCWRQRRPWGPRAEESLPGARTRRSSADVDADPLDRMHYLSLSTSITGTLHAPLLVLYSSYSIFLSRRWYLNKSKVTGCGTRMRLFREQTPRRDGEGTAADSGVRDHSKNHWYSSLMGLIRIKFFYIIFI